MCSMELANRSNESSLMRTPSSLGGVCKCSSRNYGGWAVYLSVPPGVPKNKGPSGDKVAAFKGTVPWKSVRDLVMRLIVFVLLASLGAPLLAADSAVVLMYHRFGEDRYPSTSIRIDQFEAQLQYLKEQNFAVVPLATVLAALNGDSDLPERAVVITIDDAYRSVYDVAYPRLREYGFPITVFVNTDAVDEGKAAYMSWVQMREMANHRASYANHGASHTSFIEIRDGEADDDRLERVRADVDKGWRRLSEELVPLPGAFAYPYGEYDTATADLLRDLGYISFGQQSGAVGPYSDKRALPRFPMAESYGGMSQFRTKVASLPLPVTSVDPWDPVVSTSGPLVTISLAPSDGRLGELACFISGQGRVGVDWQERYRRFAVGPESPLGEGRQRVNCTAPRNDGRYLWFSHPWIVQPTPGDTRNR